MHTMRDGAKDLLLKASVNSREPARRLENATEHQGVSCWLFRFPGHNGPCTRRQVDTVIAQILAQKVLHLLAYGR